MIVTEKSQACFWEKYNYISEVHNIDNKGSNVYNFVKLN